MQHHFVLGFAEEAAFGDAELQPSARGSRSQVRENEDPVMLIMHRKASAASLESLEMEAESCSAGKHSLNRAANPLAST